MRAKKQRERDPIGRCWDSAAHDARQALALISTGRNTTMNLSSPNDPVTITNLPFDVNGNLIDSRSRPRDAGFGVATGYMAPRTVQAQVRFQF